MFRDSHTLWISLALTLVGCGVPEQATTDSAAVTDQCDSTYECRQVFGSSATDCANSGANNSVCMCGSSPCQISIDQCDHTGECISQYGSRATDCANSGADNSVCMCGSSPCKAEPQPQPTDQCDSTGECISQYGSRATDCANSGADNSVCMCGSAPCEDEPRPQPQPQPTDQCDTTGECISRYGSRATDCANSPSEESVCMCGSSPCESTTDSCNGVNCGHGTCVLVGNSAQCNCDSGYIPQGLTCVLNNYQPVRDRAEAESVAAPGSWVRETATGGCSGGAYLRWNGGNVHNIGSISSSSILTYRFDVPSAGEYLISVRSRRDNSGSGRCRCTGDGDCNDECNDLWLRTNNEPWIKKMAGGGWNQWADNGKWQLNHHPTGVTHGEAYLNRGVNTVQIAGRSRDVKLDVIEITRAPKYRSGDLVSIHHDNAADIDDGLAIAANYTLVRELNINALVVNGTYGWQAENLTCDCGKSGRPEARFNPRSNAVMNASFGAGNWLNADANWNGSVRAAATRWLSTLNSGGTVWVAEAGQSDFTVAVIKRVRSLGFTNTKNKVRVVQHSIWNEEYTEFGSPDTGLTYLQWYQGGGSTYIRIGDGNDVMQEDSWDDPTADRPTHTADLNMRGSEINTSAFRSKALSSPYSSAWRAGFNYFDDDANWPSSWNFNRQDYIDFSDTAELLYIMGVTVNQVGNIPAFANRYL